MPRLLLVDDNPSIHRIAESLLAPTDVELVCVDSAAEALDRLGRGERFDVALVDTAMPGMDGWTLLGRLRAQEPTASMPIALMAGVLDPVDPAKLAKAPIQGFLKKPIELRELGDRVKALLATPVVPPPAAPSPFSTVPAAPASDLVQRAGISLPEYRPEPPAPMAPAPEPPPAPPEPEDDLLVLTAEDLWPEEAPEPLPAAPSEPLPEVHLELEELDLESLQDLAVEPAPAPAPEPESVFDDDALVTLSGLEALDVETGAPVEAAPVDWAPAPVEAAAEEPRLETLELPADLEPLEGLPEGFLPAEEPVLEAEPPRPAMPEPEALVPAAEMVAAALEVPAAPDLAPVTAAGGQPAAVPGQAPHPVPGFAVAGERPEGNQAQAVVQAILADPVLVDALVKAVVARMGDQALREIAWEVMPDLAGRLHP